MQSNQSIIHFNSNNALNIYAFNNFGLPEHFRVNGLTNLQSSLPPRRKPFGPISARWLFSTHPTSTGFG